MGTSDRQKDYGRVVTIPGPFCWGKFNGPFKGSYTKLIKLSKVKFFQHGMLLGRALILCFKALHKPHQRLFVAALKTLRTSLETNSSDFDLLHKEFCELELDYGKEK